MASFFGGQPSLFEQGRPVNRTRRWTDNNGVQYVLREKSYTSPNFAFSTSSRSAAGTFGEVSSGTTPHERGGLLGAAFNMLGHILSASQHSAAGNDHRRTRQPYVEDMAYGDDAHMTPRNPDRPRPLHSRVAASLSDAQQSREPRRRRGRGQRSRGSSPQGVRDRRYTQPSSNFSPSSRHSRLANDKSSGDESDGYDRCRGDTDEGLPRHMDPTAALEHAAESHGREAKLARRRLEQACRQSTGNSRHLQDLAQMVQEHEEARNGALRDLEKAQASAQRRRGARLKSRDSCRSRYNGGSTRRGTGMEDFASDPFYNDSFFEESNTYPQHRRAGHHAFAASNGFGSTPTSGQSPFAAFESLFADFHRMHNDMHQQFFNMPGASFTATFGTQPGRTAFASNGDGDRQHQQPASFASFAPPPRAPPATLLKPEEAQRLFNLYSKRWSTMSPTDANIPYPARGLSASSLTSRDSLWAPAVSSAVQTWSEETVMKANAQAFFLGAVGLKPAYGESAGAKIELGIDTPNASPAQVKQLIDILKRERVRWHSDRLGKRNEGRSGPNQALQADERARAVYHGICELLETAH